MRIPFLKKGLEVRTEERGKSRAKLALLLILLGTAGGGLFLIMKPASPPVSPSPPPPPAPPPSVSVVEAETERTEKRSAPAGGREEGSSEEESVIVLDERVLDRIFIRFEEEKRLRSLKALVEKEKEEEKEEEERKEEEGEEKVTAEEVLSYLGIPPVEEQEPVQEVVMPPVFVRIDGVACVGRACYAITNLGILKEGDEIGADETVLDISLKGIRTDRRFIPF